MFDDKKQERQAKDDFELHCKLIAKQEGVTPAKSRFMAWAEGAGGLARRLGQPVLAGLAPQGKQK